MTASVDEATVALLERPTAEAANPGNSREQQSRLEHRDSARQRQEAEAADPAVVRESPLPSQRTIDELTNAMKTAEKRIKALFTAVRLRDTSSGLSVKQVIADMIEPLMTDIDLSVRVALQTIENREVHQHCLVVAQLAMSIGANEGLSRRSILDLGAGCILSRIGQSDSATQAAEQMRHLSRSELLDLKRTPSRTFDCLQSMGEVTIGARAVAYQIFERFDGSGYPRGRSGALINPLARIASLCDVYVALTSARPQRPAFESHAAIQLLIHETREGKFDPSALRALLATIGLFPIGSFVRLTDGCVGQVVRNHRERYDRPLVHLFFDSDASFVEEERRVTDLLEREDVRIDAAVTTRRINEMVRRT